MDMAIAARKMSRNIRAAKNRFRMVTRTSSPEIRHRRIKNGSLGTGIGFGDMS